jgi:hypothetical protein
MGDYYRTQDYNADLYDTGTGVEGNIERIRDYYPIDINTILDVNVRDFIMDYIPLDVTDVDLMRIFDELIPRGASLSDIIFPNTTIIGGVEIKMSKDVITGEIIGPIYILISITNNLYDNITLSAIEIKATKVNDQFDGYYYFRWLYSTTDNRSSTVDTNTVHYSNGVKDGIHRIEEQRGSLVRDVEKMYVNGKLVDTVTLFPPSSQPEFSSYPLPTQSMVYSQGKMYPIPSNLYTGQESQRMGTEGYHVFNPEGLEEHEEGSVHEVTKMPSYSRFPPLSDRNMKKKPFTTIEPVVYQSVMKQPNQYGDPYESVSGLFEQ